MPRPAPILAALAVLALAAPAQALQDRAVAMLADAPVHVSPDGKLEVQFLVGPLADLGRRAPAGAPGGAGCAIQRLAIHPGGRVPAHVHEASDEILTIQAGGGTFMLAGRQMPVAAGATIFIPKGRAHAFMNGDAPTIASQVYDPAGPEARFGAWPRRAPGGPAPSPPAR